MTEKRICSLIGLALCLGVLFASCAAPISPSPQPELPTIPPFATSPATITYTPPPTFTPFPTQTLSPTQTETPTPYAGMDFSKVIFLWGGFLPHWQYFIALELPGLATNDFYVVVDRNKDYLCDIHPEYPKRLYCHGPQVRMQDWAPFALFVKGGDQPVFEGQFFTPLKYENDLNE